MKLYEVIDEPSKWCAHQNALDGDGYPISAFDPKARSWCLYAALMRFVPSRQKHQVLVDAVQQMGYRNIAAFNDDPETTFDIVQTLLRRLDI